VIILIRELLEDALEFGPTAKFSRLYGNYCGRGNRGGPPIDDLDAICLAHDKCYNTASGHEAPMIACDAELLRRTRDFLERPRLTVKQRLMAKAMLAYFTHRARKFATQGESYH